jgi:UDP-N-acetyl-D-glucosamine dehydrogenase
LLLGVSYLNDVGDTRYTPVEGFFDQLEIEGCSISLHDPHVLYWEEKDTWVNQDLNELLDTNYDIIAVTTGHKEYRTNGELVEKLLKQPVSFIYDTIGVFSNEEIRRLSGKHTVKVIGRGDL